MIFNRLGCGKVVVAILHTFYIRVVLASCARIVLAQLRTTWADIGASAFLVSLSWPWQIVRTIMMCCVLSGM